MDEVPYEANDQAPNGYCDSRTRYDLYYGKKTHQLTEGIESGIPSTDVHLSQEVIDANIENMQLAIMTDGPIVTGMNVYTDFFYYPHLGEVYRKRNSILVNGSYTKNEYQGGHAVVIVGWGQRTDEDGSTIKYWIAQNSWGSNWGLGGYFLIERGKNMVNFEYDAAAVMVNLHASSPAVTSFQAEPSAGGAVTATTIALIVVASVLFLIIVVLISVYASRKKK